MSRTLLVNLPFYKLLGSRYNANSLGLAYTASVFKQFEYEVAMWMTEAGYQARVTQASHDGGVDVLATRNGEKIVVQCKRWTRPVGPDKVRELAGARSDWKAERALLVTTSDFTDDALATAKRLDIELWNFEALRKNIQRLQPEG